MTKNTKDSQQTTSYRTKDWTTRTPPPEGALSFETGIDQSVYIRYMMHFRKILGFYDDLPWEMNAE